ncbi:MAG: FAD-binding and (Fe-S)-binding domain-containing protein [Marmoricola sp.]
MTTPNSDVTAALRRAGVSGVDDSPLAQALYATDASLYRVLPRVVVSPHEVGELEAVLAVARAGETAITMRGAGTSIAGNAVGPGIVVDTTPLSAVRVDADTRTATVLPGTVHARIQEAAASHGLRFGPDPSTHTRCTVGGMIGNNACGSRALGYGRTSDNLVDLTALLADGRDVAAVTNTNWVIWSMPTSGSSARSLAGSNARSLATRWSTCCPSRGRSLARFLVGSEGTLAIVTSATVNLVEEPGAKALVVIGYPDMATAADAVPLVLEHGPVACEGLDRRMSDVVAARWPLPELPAGGGWLLVELTGDSAGEAEAKALALAKVVNAPHRVVTDAAEQAALWRIREAGAGLAAVSLDKPAHAGWEDAAVPPERLGDYLRDFERLLSEFGLRTVPYGHFGDGCVHARIDFDLSTQGQYRHFVEEAAVLAANYGGSMSGEHGDGRARSELLGRMYSPQAMALMAAVKHIFDPDNLLNPGVLVDPAPLDASLRASRVTLPVMAELGAEVHRCTGVGACLAGPGSGVMCPSYSATREEKDSTRGRARVLQEVVTGALPVTSEAVEQALDLCLACKGCARDCPTGVDMAEYKSQILELKYSKANGARARTESWGAYQRS